MLGKAVFSAIFGVKCIYTRGGGFRDFGGMQLCIAIQKKTGKKRKRGKKTSQNLKKKSGEKWGRKKVRKERRKRRKKDNRVSSSSSWKGQAN